jgi:hypothetical protein
VAPVPAAKDLAPLTPEEKMRAEPSWLDLGKIRGLLGWGTEVEKGEGERWSLGEDVLGYEWGWR